MPLKGPYLDENHGLYAATGFWDDVRMNLADMGNTDKSLNCFYVNVQPLKIRKALCAVQVLDKLQPFPF